MGEGSALGTGHGKRLQRILNVIFKQGTRGV